MAAAAIFSCDQDQAETLKPEITVAIEASPSALDPRLARDAYSIQIMPLAFPGLFKIGSNLEPEPDLVESFEQPDATTFIFRLRQGVRFANGKELSASDVKATLESLNTPGLNSPYLELAERIKTVSIHDRHVLRIETKEPYAPILVELNLGILPEEIARKKPPLATGELIGAGPFRIGKWVPGSELALERNPYYSEGVPFFERVRFRVIPEDITRLLSLEKGEVQLIQTPIPADELARLKSNPRLSVSERPGINYTYMGFNLRDPILANPGVRAAIAHAIDRDQIVCCLLKDTASKADSLISPRHWAFEPEVEKYEYDPALAKSLLDEAGYPDPDGNGPLPRFSLGYKTSQNQQRLWIAQAIARQLGKVGIEVEVRSLEWGTLYADIQAGNFQLYTLTWVGVVEPDIYYTAFHSQSLPPGGANRGAYSNPEVDTLVVAARMSQDRGARKILYSRVQKILAQEIPCVSLWDSVDIVAADRRLAGFELGPGGEWTSLKSARWRP